MVRSAWHTAVYCFWMNCRNFTGRHWRVYVSRWKMEVCRFTDGYTYDFPAQFMLVEP